MQESGYNMAATHMAMPFSIPLIAFALANLLSSFSLRICVAVIYKHACGGARPPRRAGVRKRRTFLYIKRSIDGASTPSGMKIRAVP